MGGGRKRECLCVMSVLERDEGKKKATNVQIKTINNK